MPVEPNMLGEFPPPPDPSMVDMGSMGLAPPNELCAAAPKGVGTLDPKGVEVPDPDPKELLNGVVAPPPKRPPVEPEAVPIEEV